MRTRAADDPGEVFLDLTDRERSVLRATLIELVFALPIEVTRRTGLPEWVLEDVDDCLAWRQPPICDPAVLRGLATALRTLVVELHWDYAVRVAVDAQDARRLGEALDAAARDLDAATLEIDATGSGLGGSAERAATAPGWLRVAAVTASCVELRCDGAVRAALIGALVEATAAALTKALRQVAQSLGGRCEMRVGVPHAELLAVADLVDGRLAGLAD